jgi:hypothetical protein
MSWGVVVESQRRFRVEERIGLEPRLSQTQRFPPTFCHGRGVRCGIAQGGWYARTAERALAVVLRRRVLRRSGYRGRQFARLIGGFAEAVRYPAEVGSRPYEIEPYLF